MPRMKPVETTYDPDQIDNNLASFSKQPRSVFLALSEKVETFGTVTVDGVKLSCCEQIKDALGKWKLLIPVGEVAYEYERSYTVALEGFCGKFGRKFPTCTFILTTTARREKNEQYAEHDSQALNAAREGMVLLKNEGNVLPLPKNATLNCFGEAQHLYRMTATGASKINPRWAPNFQQAVDEHSGFTVNRELSEFYRVGNGIPDENMLHQALNLSDTALIFIGRHSGECQDNRPVPGQYYLTEAERKMIRFVTAAFEKTVLILNIGHPIELQFTQELGISSILYTGYAGMLSAYALVEILDGRVNPSGCLPDTWSWDYYDSPVSLNQPVLREGALAPTDKSYGVRIYYEEGIYQGYRYFDTFGKPVAFPFGHGLSFTEFEVTAEKLHFVQGNIGLDITVRNIGSVPGKKVVQLYVAAPEGKLEKPAHQLVCFEKTRQLAPGESQILHLTADDRSMASFDEATASWVLEKGRYTFYVGCIGNMQQVGEFVLDEDQVLATNRHLGCPVEPLDCMTRNNPNVEGKKSGIVPLYKRFAVRAKRTAYRPERLPRYRGKPILWEDLRNDPTKLDDFVSQMSLADLAKLNVCAGGLWGEGENGCAGHTYALERYGLPSFCVSDANAGVNIRKPNIGFPASSVIAATFNKDIAYTVGRVIAEESLENGVFLNLGPGMNLHRNMLCGRHPEYFSEDPFLTGTMAGYHGKGLEENGLACCYKHLFCNGSDLSRMGSHSVVGEQALRELYFRCFELAFSIQKPSSVMTSYNALNGLYPAENAQLLQGLVRGEWKFDGFIMSDWNSYHTVNAIEMVKAGNCWLTLGGMFWVWVIRLAAYTGMIRRAVLEQNVRYLMKILLEKNGNK